MDTVLVNLNGVCIDMNSALRKKSGIKTVESYNNAKIKRTCSVPIDNVLEYSDVQKEAQLYDGVVEAIERLKEVVNVEIYTAVTPNSPVEEIKKQQIAELGVDAQLVPVNCLAVGTKKTLDDKKYVAIFEDSISTLEKWIEYDDDVLLFLIDQPHNYADTPIIWSSENLYRCESLAEAVNIFLSFYDARQALDGAIFTKDGVYVSDIETGDVQLMDIDDAVNLLNSESAEFQNKC